VKGRVSAGVGVELSRLLPSSPASFGDMAKLMQSADRAFERYLDAKRRAPRSDDPVADVWAGWDSHADAAPKTHATARRGAHAVRRHWRKALRILRKWSNRITAANRARGPWR
jgi:hypothetical protein